MNIRELDPAQQLGIREMQPRPSEAQVRRFLAEGLPILKGTVSRMFSDVEKASVGPNEEDATKEASVIGEVLGQDIGTQAQNYLANLKRYGKLATFLQEDNSGFTLLDQLLADINSGTMFPFLTPEYVQEGAKIGAELYKRLYPLSE